MNKLFAFLAAFLTTIAIAVVPVMGIRGASHQAPPPAYEYEVLSGLQSQEVIEFSCRWHSNTMGCVLKRGEVPDGASLDMVLHEASFWGTNKQVHAVFRRIADSRNLHIDFRLTSNRGKICRGVIADIIDTSSEANDVVATVYYTHVFEDHGDRAAGRMAVEEREMVPLADLQSANDKGLVGDVANKAQERCDPEAWTAAHLHQAVKSSSVQNNRNDGDDDKGIPRAEATYAPNPKNPSELTLQADPRPYPCFSSSMWLWKISSGTPPVTATDAPTDTCPPVELTLTPSSNGSLLDLAFTFGQTGPDAATDAVIEMYKEPTGGFCDADADNCTPVATATPTADEDTSAFPASVAFDNLKSGKYRARGRGCIEESSSVDCGAWSAWSNTIDYVPPPRNLVLTASGRNLHLSFVADDPVELVLSGPSSTGRCPPSCIDNVKRVGVGPREVVYRRGASLLSLRD